jgi:hypothetical protein
MNISVNRVVPRQLLAGLSAALWVVSFFAFDAMNSASVAQQPRFSDHCDERRVVEDWLDRHQAIDSARRALRDMIAAVNDKYQDADFGYDPKSNKDRRREFTEAFERARVRFEELIASAAHNSTPACRVCQLTAIYEKAVIGGEGDTVTLQELELLPELFSDLAADQDELTRKEAKMKEFRDAGRDPDSDEVRIVRDTIRNLRESVRGYHDALQRFRSGSPRRDPDSPKMATEKNKYVCDRMPGDRPPPGR